MKIGSRTIGNGHPAFIIAELSANHGQSLERAKELVHAAATAGADAVKLQTYTADTITLDCDNEHFQIKSGTIWDGQTLHKLYQEAYTPWDWQPELKELANSLGMECFSSPFDDSAVDFLEGMGVPAYKIASFELVDTGLIERVSATGKPVILSTGMAALDEIDQAVETARSAGCKALALLVCSSSYPAPPEQIHLRRIPHLRERFSCEVGLSDHTLGIAVPVASIALGASMIEKHLTLRRADGGPDAAFSLEPSEFQKMVANVRIAEAALGRVDYGHEAESPSRAFRRSLFVVADVAKGEVLTSEKVRSIRPAAGLSPLYLPAVIGRRALKSLKRGEPITWEVLEREI